MIKFSWKKINDKFGWDRISVLQYFFLKQKLPIPPPLSFKVPKKVKNAAKYRYINGPCFLINPDEALLKAENYFDLYMYMELASLRSIFDYNMRGVKHLSVALVPKYYIDRIDDNPLLIVKDQNIYFKYEQE